ncbi:MAG: enoyl-CoA hydratase/isomerase family protein [Hyphomonas sp.]|nr:enoyl-CoA hydratase/isomerase family protein [Hyphomonas sp.]HRX74688.1 enoyl-CoA hydratase/isomerase family protein [Hyphomonas sp.]
MSELVRTEIDGRIAIVRFDTGARANALSQQAMQELTEAALQFHDAPDISAVILTGRDDQFSMGADLKDPAGTAAAKSTLRERRILLRRGPRMCEAWENIDALTICAIEGWCVGGGVAVATSCDLRVAAENSTFYVPEVERGMNMSWGSIPRFVALVGPARAKRIAGLCEKVDAETALNWGLADHVVPAGTSLHKAREIAEAASRLPPTALKMVKQDVNVAAHALAKATAHRDLEAFALLQRSDDFREGIKAFLEGRDPEFTGD